MYDKDVEMLLAAGVKKLSERKEPRGLRQLLYVDGVLVAAISDKKAIDYLDERVDVHVG